MYSQTDAFLWDESFCQTKTLIYYEAWKCHGGGGSRKGRFRVEISYGLWGSICHTAMDSFGVCMAVDCQRLRWEACGHEGVDRLCDLSWRFAVYFQVTSLFLYLHFALFRVIVSHLLSIQRGEPLVILQMTDITNPGLGEVFIFYTPGLERDEFHLLKWICLRLQNNNNEIKLGKPQISIDTSFAVLHFASTTRHMQGGDFI